MFCIKYFFIAYINFLVYEKLFPFSLKTNFALKVFLSLIFTFIMFFVGTYCKIITLPLVFILSVIVNKIIYKNIWVKTFILTMFSISISYWGYYISGILTMPIDFFIYRYVKSNFIKDFIFFNIVGFVSILLIFVFFKLKKFKRGVAYLGDTTGANIGIIIGIVSLLSIFVLYANVIRTIQTMIITALTFLCCGIFILWWKKYVDNLYLTKLHKRDIEILEKGLEESKIKIDYLSSQNNELASIIHKDNKILPAMEMAVLDFISNKKNLNKKGTAADILKELDDLYKERTNLIDDYQKSSKKQNKTDILYLDAIVNFLNSEALKRDINFNFSSCCDKSFLEKEDIVKSLGTLMADLGINAINSINCSGQSIKICLSEIESVLTLTVYDTGNEIDKNVFLHMGLSNYTTHSADGGSGIGLMTVFNIMQKYKASFIINEKENFFNKSISVRFDKKYNVVVNTNRQDVIKICNNRGFVIASKGDKCVVSEYKTA